MHMFKRIIALLLAAVMLVSELPTAALAEMLEGDVVEEIVQEGSETAEEETEAAASGTEASDPSEATGETESSGTTGEVESSGTTGETEPSGTTGEVESSGTTGGTESSGTTGGTESSGTEDTEATEGKSTVPTGEDMEEGSESIETPTPGEPGVSDGISWDYDDENCILTISGDGEMLDASAWLDYGGQAETIVIQEGVTGICESAFWGFSQLELVLLPNSLEYIDAFAFGECTALQEIFIPAGVTEIGMGAFSGCEALTAIQISGYDVTIEENSFEGVSATVFYPYDSQWNHQSGYGGSLNWMAYCKLLGTGIYGTQRWVVEEYGTLQLYGSGTVAAKTSAAGYPWYAHKNDISMVTVSGVDNVPAQAFAGYSDLVSIRVGGVASVDAGAFSGCTGVERIYLDGVFQIAADAFTDVTAKVIYEQADGWTEDQMLDYGGSLDWSVLYSGSYGENIAWRLEDGGLSIYAMGEGTAVMEDQTSAAGYPWYAYRDQVREVWTTNVSVGDYAFAGYSDLETVQFYGTNSIGTGAFADCTSLSELFFDCAAPEIAADAFTGVTAQAKYNSSYAWTDANFQNYGGSLTWGQIVYVEPEVASGTHGDNASWTLTTTGTLTITGEGEMANQTSAEGYGWYAYRDQIRRINLEGLTSIGDYAFSGCTVLDRLNIAASVTSVGSRILDGCEGVSYVEFLGAPPVIAEDAFSGLTGARILYPYACRDQWEAVVEKDYGGTENEWSVRVQNIADGTFEGGHWQVQENNMLRIYTTQEEAVAIPEMEDGAYPWSSYAGQVTEVSFKGISSIGSYAFKDFTALTYVTFPEELTAIGTQAFAGCTALGDIFFDGEVSAIGENAFQNVTAHAHYYTDWDSTMLQNYGGTLTWTKSTRWLDGGDLDSNIQWNLYSDGQLALSAETFAVMPSLASAAAYPWSGYAGKITQITTSNITGIGDYAFAGCAQVTELLFDYHIADLGNYIFDGCTALKMLRFDGSAPEFSENTFYGVTATVEYPTADVSWTADKRQNYGGTITWPSLEEGGGEAGGETGGTDQPATSGSCGDDLAWTLDLGTLTISGTGAMWSFDDSGSSPWYDSKEQITAVVIEEGVTTVGAMAFAMHTAMETVQLPSTLTEIGSWAFSNCSGLQTVDIPTSVTKIGAYAFSNCVLLTEVVVPYAVTAVGEGMFLGCTALERVHMPSFLATMPANVFESTTTVYVHGDSPTAQLLMGMDVNVEGTAHTYRDGYYCIYCGKEKPEGGSCGENLTWTLEDGTLTISGTGEMDIYDNFNLVPGWYYEALEITRIVLEEGVTSVGDHAFRDDYTNVTEIVLPESLARIGAYAFSGSINVTELTFGQNLESIGEYAFAYAALTGELVLPDSLISIGESAFQSCSSITSLKLGSSLDTIDSGAFTGCSGITGELVIPASVTAVGDGAFAFCSGITHVRFEGADCPAFESAPLRSMSGLKSVYVPSKNYASYEALLATLPEGVEIQTDQEAFPVEGLAVSAAYSKTVVLTWEAHESGMAAGYTILRDGVAVGTTTECTYTDRTLEAQTRYSYTVQAYFTDGAVSPESEAVTAETVVPEITGLSGCMEYANLKIFAQVHNTIWVTAADKGNLAPLGQQQSTLGLYYSNGEEETLIGWAQPEQTQNSGNYLMYSIDWDMSTLSDGVYTLRAVLTDVDGTTAQWTEEVTVDNTPPAKLLQLTAIGAEENIQLSWTRAQEYDTTGYHIYRSADTQDSFEWLADINGAATLSYTDHTAAEDKTYYYYVVAVDIFEREALEYDVVGCSRITDTEKPRVVQMLPVSGSYLSGVAAFTLKTEDNVAVTDTKLAYSVDQETTWTELEPVDGRYTLNTAELEDGEIRVRAFAYDAAGNVSDAFRQIYTIDNTGPAQVTGLNHVSTSVTMTLRWEDVADQDIGGFLVEQLQSDGSYAAVAEKVTALGVNLQNLTPNTEYTYRVTSYDIFGNMGIPSEPYTAATAADTTAPVTVQILPASNSFRDRISLTATVQDDNCVASAVLEYSLDNISWTEVCTKTYTDGAAVQKISAELDLTDIPEGLLYVRVTAVDKAGNASVDAPFVQHMVDKTAPVVPASVTAIGGNGYVELRWASSPDVAAYTIYRAEAEDGEFLLIADEYTYLNYVDRNVEDGTVYYYKVAAVDAAGNVSECCEAVSAQVSSDTQAPEILSISPVNGGILSSSFPEISVLVKDNSCLSSILVEYSHDGQDYVTLTERQGINAYGTTAAGTIPVGEFVHGDTVYVRVTAADCAGNACDPMAVVYTIDTQAPLVSEVTAQYSDGAVLLSWTGGAEEDLAGYRVYRRDSAGTNSLIGQVAVEAGRTAYTWEDGSLPLDGGTFTYQIEAVDTVGNTATGSSSEAIPGQNTPVVEVPERSGPTALLVCDTVMTVGVEYIIDGSGSTDNGHIVSYEYSFGDGTTGTGKSPVHTYTQEGTYTITLTVTDNDGRTQTMSRRVTVKEPNLVGQVSVRIIDEKGAPVPNAPVYFDLGEETQVIRGTDSSGWVTFTAAVGRHTVGCVILDNQWLPVKRDLIVNAGETTSVSMTLINKPIVEGTFEIKRMTLEEIEAAGIDLSDPENQYYVEVDLHLVYENVEINESIPGKYWDSTDWPGPPIIIDSTGKYKPKKKKDDDPDPIVIDIDDEDDDDDDDVRGWWPILIDKSSDPKVMILDIPIGVQSLKEMFDVRLHILNNSSSEFSMLDNTITLNTPKGLSVVTDAYMANRQTVNVAEIQGQTQKTVDWIVRGDEPGEYMLSADYSGILSQFNEPLTARFEAGTPIEVYGMTGMKLVIEVAEELENGTLYYNVIVQNDGELDIYKPSITTEDVLIEMQLYDVTGSLRAEGETKSGMGLSIKSLSDFPDILNVGDSLVMHYMSIDQTEYTHCVMKLREMLVEYANTYGLEDVELIEQPLEYFRESMNTKVNSQEKADQTFTDNKSAYNQIINNKNYVYWAMANDKMDDYKLSSNADEAMWTALREGIAAAATNGEDSEQIKAMVIELLEMSAESVDDIKYSKQLKFLKKLRSIVDGISLKDIMGEYADSFEKALDSAYGELSERGVLHKTGSPYALESLIYEHWKTHMLEEDLEILDKASSFIKLQKLLADKESEDAWKAAGLTVKAIDKVRGLTEDVLVDLEWILEAQAKEDAIMLCLDAMIENFSLSMHLNYEDSWDVYNCLVNMKEMLGEHGIAFVIISNIVELIKEYGIDKLVGKGTDKIMEMAGGSGDPLTFFIIQTVKLTAWGVDMLTNVSQQHDMADNIRFAAMLSDTTRSAVKQARSAYKSNKTAENAAKYMQLLKLLINIRAVGESQVALYGKSFETDFTVGNMPLLMAVRAKTDAESATSWYQWRDIVEDRISRLRVQLLRNPLTTEVTGREKPTVSFDYSKGQTLQSFDASFEYSVDNGESWTPCDGSPIWVEAPDIRTELWVRKIDRSNTDMQGTGSVTIYGPLSTPDEIEVLKTTEGYRIDNLDPEKIYQVTFSAEPMPFDYTTVLETQLPEGSESYILDTDAVYQYAYIRAAADQNGYASNIAQLDIVSTVTLNVFITGEGLVSDYETVWEYGSRVSVTAIPAEDRIFDGWYHNGSKVSGNLTHTFPIYTSMYLEARFREADPLPGVSAPINAENGSASVTTEDRTLVSITGASEAARMLVVETVSDAVIQEWISECLAVTEIGLPTLILEIYTTDENRMPMALNGETVALEREGIAEDMLLCGVAQEGGVTVLDNSCQDGQIRFAGNGSAYYVLTTLPTERYIDLETSAQALLPGETAQLSARFLPGNPTGTEILWRLAEGDAQYASLMTNGETAELTALPGNESREVTVTASAADGSFPSTAVKIQVLPYVHQLTIHTQGRDVTGGKIRFDLNREGNLLEMTAVAAPEGAIQAVTWETSDEEIAEVTEDGLVTFMDKTGEVVITAKATDGSGKSASVTIEIVALIQNVEMAKDSVTELVGGESASFKAIDADTGITLTKAQLTWTLDEEYASYASISADGKLKTRAVEEETKIVITGRIVGNEAYGVVEHTVILRPEVTYVELRYEDEMVNGDTILIDTEGAAEGDLPSIRLEALLHPGGTMEGVTWKSRNAGIADVDQNGVVTVKWDAKKKACKTGTVTITATAEDGSRMVGSVKLNVGVTVKKIDIEAPDLELRSGKKMTLSAETTPEKPTKKGVTWSLAGEDDSSFATISTSGKLTAKTVYERHTVTVRATAKDGSGIFAEIPVLILPKDDGILTIRNGEENVTKTTVAVDLNEDPRITLEAYTLGADQTEVVTWKSSSKSVATLEDHKDGTVTVTLRKSGATTITATAEDGRTAKVTLKGVKLTQDITVTSKTGEMAAASGKSLTLKGTVTPANATVKTILWSVAEEDRDYASITSRGKLTAAKNLLEARTITVIAAAKDGGAVEQVKVRLTPLATGIRIFREEQAVTSTTQIHNMVDSDTLQLTAKVYPLGQASTSVTWKSSNKKIASISEDGEITCLKAGTVTITATVNDGSKQKSTFKLRVEKWMTELTLPDTAVIAGGKSLTMTKLEDYFVDPDASDKTLIWSMEGEGAAFATLSQKGVLKTKKVTEPKRLTVTATAADGGAISASCEVTIYPATTKVQILCDGEVVTKKLTLEVGDKLYLEGTSLPVSAADAYTWKTSSRKYATVDEDGVVTAVKAGKTVSISCVAADKSGKSAVVKIQTVEAK